MDPIERMERMREAQHRLRAQQQRRNLLRGRVVAISLIAFVVLWGVVFAQMATGNDPVLGRPSATKATPAAVATESIETSAPEELESELDEPEPVEEEFVEVEPVEEEFVEVEPEPAPVITSQS